MKNSVQSQAGYSLPEFMGEYGTEEQCHNARFKLRWPQGHLSSIR